MSFVHSREVHDEGRYSASTSGLSLDLRGSNATKRVEGSTLVGLRHPVIDLQEAFKAGSIFFICDDLLHTSETFFCVVAKAVVRIIPAWTRPLGVSQLL